MRNHRFASNEIDEWSQALEPLAPFQHPLQTLGLVTEANWNSWTTDDLRPYVDYALDLFGADRLMFGSDYPVCLLAASYDRVLESFQEILRELNDSDRDKIFSKNAARFYRLNSRCLRHYFITGAQGCIGSWIVKALTERGDSAVVFDRSDDSRRLRAIMDADDLAKVRFITGDITDGPAVLSALR